MDDAAEHAFQDRKRQDTRVLSCDRAFVRDPHAVSTLTDRREHAAEPLRQSNERPDGVAELAADVNVHRVLRELAAQRQRYLLGDRHTGLVLRLVCGGAQVRRHDDLLELEQRRRRRRLLLEYVETCSAQTTIGDRLR